MAQVFVQSRGEWKTARVQILVLEGGNGMSSEDFVSDKETLDKIKMVVLTRNVKMPFRCLIVVTIHLDGDSL